MIIWKQTQMISKASSKRCKVELKKSKKKLSLNKNQLTGRKSLLKQLWTTWQKSHTSTFTTGSITPKLVDLTTGVFQFAKNTPARLLKWASSLRTATHPFSLKYQNNFGIFLPPFKILIILVSILRITKQLRWWFRILAKIFSHRKG